MHVLSMVSQKGGSGRTTLSAHLAVAAEALGLSTAIVDMDPQSSAWKWAQRRKGEPPEVITANAVTLDSILERGRGGGIDLIVIDTPPYADVIAGAAIKAADLVLTPVRPSIFDIDALKPVLEMFEARDVRPLIVLNGCSTASSADTEDAREALAARGLEIYPGMIHERLAFKRAPAAGQTVQEANADPKAIREIEELFAFVAARLGLNAKTEVTA